MALKPVEMGEPARGRPNGVTSSGEGRIPAEGMEMKEGENVGSAAEGPVTEEAEIDSGAAEAPAVDDG